MKKILAALLICCLIPSCTGCKGRKGRVKRHEPQPVMLRDKPTPRPAEVKQVSQPALAPQRVPQPVGTAPTGEPVPRVKSEPGVQYIQEGELEEIR